MEKLLTERFQRLESALNSIKLETRPTKGHPDPGALQDYWLIVEEYITGIKSKIRQIVHDSWTISHRKARGEDVHNYDELLHLFGIETMQYMQEDNNNDHWNNIASYTLKSSTAESARETVDSDIDLENPTIDQQIAWLGTMLQTRELGHAQDYFIAIKGNLRAIKLWNDSPSLPQKKDLKSIISNLIEMAESWGHPEGVKNNVAIKDARAYVAMLDGYTKQVDVEKVIEDLLEQHRQLMERHPSENVREHARTSKLDYLQNAEVALGMLKAFKEIHKPCFDSSCPLKFIPNGVKQNAVCVKHDCPVPTTEKKRGHIGSELDKKVSIDFEIPPLKDGKLQKIEVPLGATISSPLYYTDDIPITDRDELVKEVSDQIGSWTNFSIANTIIYAIEQYEKLKHGK